jgi:hypothetical protein
MQYGVILKNTREYSTIGTEAKTEIEQRERKKESGIAF